MNSLEGFLRQVIGWREFMRATYEDLSVPMRTTNHWQHHRAMPNSFYDGTTGIEPIDDTIRRILDTGYCHHIERLMVLGGFMFLCEIDPDDIYRWFMEMFVDSYDWVMVPNVYAMSQNADGGTITTKPYFSGSSYIRKMSHYKQEAVVRNLGWTVLAMGLESCRRSWEEPKMGDDVQHGEEDEGQQAKATFGSRGGVREQVVLVSLRPHRLLTELSGRNLRRPIPDA